ncbi:MAG TPA: protease, partial [Acidimicrobiia bacterium]|nr:protease [Acidimicrobiia bacterium]
VALAIAGGLFFVKQQMRFPGGHQPVGEVASLLERVDASPITGIPVELRGRLIGRGFPGYRLSPDLVIQDESGFVTLAYRQPVAFIATLFGLLRAERFLGQDVVARGWYRRSPGPVVELLTVTAADGRKARSITAPVRRFGAVALLVAGILMALAGLSG